MNTTAKIIIGIIFGAFGIFILAISYNFTFSYYMGNPVNVKIHKIDSSIFKKKNNRVFYNYSALASFRYKEKIISDKKLFISEDEKAKDSIYRNYHPAFGYLEENNVPIFWTFNFIGIAFLFSAIVLFVYKFK